MKKIYFLLLIGMSIIHTKGNARGGVRHILQSHRAVGTPAFQNSAIKIKKNLNTNNQFFNAVQKNRNGVRTSSASNLSNGTSNLSERAPVNISSNKYGAVGLGSGLNSSGGGYGWPAVAGTAAVLATVAATNAANTAAANTAAANTAFLASSNSPAEIYVN
ncbi:hypothetical protein P618_200906 [Holospora obtusa F1]|uniref:Uncharacterized protein n=1 Tax=Holospora obtusa F1 TaxID=1399147 RepID=W6TD88_HOLOB|nr:hypothetical protein [Holospora obtusa]ETZ06933.1 hypothetical protein P618_200906 [Holospora obtusa F1]